MKVQKVDIRVQATENNFIPDHSQVSSYVRIVQNKTVLGELKLSYMGPQKLGVELDVLTGIADVHFIQVSLVKALLGRINFFGLPTDIELISCQTSTREAMEMFGFKATTKDEMCLQIAADKVNKLARLKRALAQARSSNPVYGRGFALDVSIFDPGDLDLLMDEYNDLAWGRTSWAMHGRVADDEIRLIETLANSDQRVLEVGAGSGRLTSVLAKNFRHVTATDYLESVVGRLGLNMQKASIQNVSAVQHDIMGNDMVDGPYDKVFLLENGLGAFLNFKDRKRAFLHMARHLKVGGELVLGLRTLGHRALDHVMPASQDPIFFGIYHTFSMDEIQLLIPPELKIERVIYGDDRPAGGRALFYVIQKTCELP